MLNPFLQRQKPFPLKLIVDIHSFCNARCRMCPYPRYSPRQSQGYMHWDLYQRIVDELADIGQKNDFRPRMTYCYMAEPFVAEDISRHTAYAEKQNIDVYLNTNAAEMTPKKVDALLKTGFHGMIHISFHGITPELYEKIMGLDYQTSLSHIQYLLQHYDRKRVCIRGVDDNWPKGEHQRWLDFWKPCGVELEYLPPISRCGSVARLSKQKKEKPRLFGCSEHHPLVEMVILFDGRAVMCCQDMGREVIWGNVADDGLLDVWNSPTRQELIQRLYAGKPQDKTFLCTRCEQAITTRTALTTSILNHTWKKIKTRV